jgi:DNA-binding MarR family transcriptional regulator
MGKKSSSGIDPYQFIRNNIDTVPHLEALVLLWNSRPVHWRPEELASRLYVETPQAEELLNDLARLNLVARFGDQMAKYCYLSGSAEQDELMAQVDACYRRDLVRISNMIHSKASSALREFARAFRFKRERD